MEISVVVVAGKPGKAAGLTPSYHGSLTEYLSSPDAVRYLFATQASNSSKSDEISSKQPFLVVRSISTPPSSHEVLAPRVGAAPLLLLCLVGTVKPSKWTMTDESESDTLSLGKLLDGVLTLTSTVREVVILLCVRQDAWDKDDADEFLAMCRAAAAPTNTAVRVFHARDGTLDGHSFRESLAARTLLTRFQELGVDAPGHVPPQLASQALLSAPPRAEANHPVPVQSSPPDTPTGQLTYPKSLNRYWRSLLFGLPSTTSRQVLPSSSTAHVAAGGDAVQRDKRPFSVPPLPYRVERINEWQASIPASPLEDTAGGGGGGDAAAADSSESSEVKEALRKGHLVLKGVTKRQREVDPDVLSQPDQFYCDVCELQVSGSGNWKLHLAGKSHQSKVTGASGTYSCKLCAKDIQGPAQAHAHVVSAKHLAKTR